MSFSLLSVKNKYHKNGIWSFTKILNKIVGEERYDAIRVYRRIWQARIWYTRQ
jgi:hypothetical protein